MSQSYPRRTRASFQGLKLFIRPHSLSTSARGLSDIRGPERQVAIGDAVASSSGQASLPRASFSWPLPSWLS